MTRDNDDLPTCPTCRPMPPEASSPNVSAKVLREVAEVLAATSGKRYSDSTHWVDQLLFIYELKTLLECSFPDQTEHKYGCVVRTKCGLVLNIGHECGERRIRGLKELLVRDAALNRHQRRLVEIRGASDVFGRVPPIVRDVRLFTFLVEMVDKHISSLGDAMRSIASGRAENRVELSRKGLDGKKVVERFQIAGVGLFRDQPDADAIVSERTYVERLVADHPEPDEGWAKKIAKDLRALEERLDAANAWLARSRAFFSPDNYRLALHAADIRDVEVEDDLMVTAKGYGIGIGGLVRMSDYRMRVATAIVHDGEDD